MPKKSKQLREKYKGDLKKPIKLPPVPVKPTILGEEKNEREKNKIFQSKIEAYEQNNSSHILSEAQRKMHLLVEKYGLDKSKENVWFEVALNLAIDHVPGFVVEKKGQRGRKPKWNYIHQFRLYFDVLKLTKGDLQNNYILTACHDLSKQEPWKSFINSKRETADPAKTLQNQFAEARKSPLVRMFESLPDDPELKQEIYEKIIEDSDLLLKDCPVK